jgi:hypothetical protein
LFTDARSWAWANEATLPLTAPRSKLTPSEANSYNRDRVEKEITHWLEQSEAIDQQEDDLFNADSGFSTGENIKAICGKRKYTAEPWVKYIQWSCMALFRDQPMGVI